MNTSAQRLFARLADFRPAAREGPEALVFCAVNENMAVGEAKTRNPHLEDGALLGSDTNACSRVLRHA